jgi:hypothetical protein
VRTALTRWWVIIAAVAACGEGAATPAETPGPPAIATIEVSAATSIASIGATRQLTATARTAAGAAISGTSFTWASTNPDVATVNTSGGLVTAVANGATSVTASAGNVTGSTPITVQQIPGSIGGVPTRDTILAAGQTKAFSAQVRDTGGTVIAGPTAAWSSSNTTVATIHSTTGVATAIATGSTTLTVTAGPVARDVTLIVRNGVLVGNRVLLTDYGNVNDNAYLVDDYFVVWWHKSTNYATEAQQILNWLKGVKAEAATQLGLQHPPTDARGTYLNIYIHEPGPGNDNYPDGWGAGVGTDGNRLPFMSVGSSQRNDQLLFRHEGFHLYQYTGSQTGGFEYTGDGSWFSEAAATWYAALALRTDDNTHRGAATVPANPQLALWHGWTNPPAGDPVNWNRTTRQYALGTWLDYLTTTAGAPVSVIVDGYKTPTTMLPQEFLQSRVSELGAKLADYAAATTPEMPYLTRPQWTLALQDLGTYGDAADRHEYIVQLVDAGTGGGFVAPPTALRPRGWGWNVIRVSSTQAATWRFEVDGSPTGSDGAAALFQARLVVSSAGGRTVHMLPLANSLDGSIEVTTTAAATEMYLIVAAVPLHFRGHQTYSYQVKIDRN